MTDYISVDVELFFDPRRGAVRVRPLPGQKYPTTMVIECDKSFREKHKVGDRFRLNAKEKVKKTEDCRAHLYSRYSWGAEPIS